jgi:hypothetical protein
MIQNDPAIPSLPSLPPTNDKGQTKDNPPPSNTIIQNEANFITSNYKSQTPKFIPNESEMTSALATTSP